MSDLLKGLNNRQLIAVRDSLDKPTLVLAGAGSGKTSVTTKRAAYLMDTYGVNPSNIMIVTFTTKAAKEMKERVAKLVGEKEANRLTMGTFHSIALQILRRYGSKIGLKKGFGIFDTDDQKQIMRQALASYGEATDANNVRLFMGKISDAKNKLLTPEKFYKRMTSQIQNQVQDKTVYKVYKEYQALMEHNNSVDFDDLIMKTVHLLESSTEVREYYQKRYKYVSVDEYQDSNPAQYRLIRLITGDNNLFVVGDDYQSIYGFRGSDISIILNFEQDYPDCNIIKLEQNYRSTKTVVHAGNSLMTHNKGQKRKVLFTDNEKGEKLKFFEARDGLAEARFIAEEIQNLVKYEGRKYSDFAILYRMNFLSQEIEKQLAKHMIPYTIVGGLTFYERMEIKDTLAFLRIVTNPSDDIGMKRVLGLMPGIGKTTITAIAEEADSRGLPLVGGLKHYVPTRAAARNALEVCRDLLNELHRYYNLGKAISDAPVSEMLELVWKKTGYYDKLKAAGDEESVGRLANLDELVNVAKQYEKDIEEPSIIEFLENATLSTSERIEEESNQVQMMTIHASKGLEFPVVFNPGWDDGLFPSKRAITPEDVAEERRLAYVALTRAKENAYIMTAKSRVMYRQTEYNSPSRFIEELPDEVLEVI